MKLFMVSIFLAMTSPCLAASVPNMRPGEYATEYTISMKGMPMKMPDRTFKQTNCVTKEDVANRDEFIKKMQQDKNCKISDVNISGDTATWGLTCDQNGMKMVGKGKAVWQADMVKGEHNMKMSMPGQKMAMENITRFQSKRVGDCKK